MTTASQRPRSRSWMRRRLEPLWRLNTCCFLAQAAAAFVAAKTVRSTLKLRSAFSKGAHAPLFFFPNGTPTTIGFEMQMLRRQPSPREQKVGQRLFLFLLCWPPNQLAAAPLREESGARRGDDGSGRRRRDHRPRRSKVTPSIGASWTPASAFSLHYIMLTTDSEQELENGGKQLGKNGRPID